MLPPPIPTLGPPPNVQRGHGYNVGFAIEYFYANNGGDEEPEGSIGGPNGGDDGPTVVDRALLVVSTTKFSPTTVFYYVDAGFLGP